MAHSFKTNNGVTTFGVFKEPQSSGDYILNKKAKTVYCNPNICIPIKNVGSQSNLNMLKLSNYLKYYNCKNSFNNRNLNVNLITQLNLMDVPVLQNNITLACPTTMTKTSNVIDKDPPYIYTIDPSGNLFGNTTCGINNYVGYMEPLPKP
jgi:hypothetical protein